VQGIAGTGRRLRHSVDKLCQGACPRRQCSLPVRMRP
jgi:hypothetical protein